VISELHRRHRAAEYLKLLRAIDEAVRAELDVQIDPVRAPLRGEGQFGSAPGAGGQGFLSGHPSNRTVVRRALDHGFVSHRSDGSR
jgi:hypothetical protein